MPITIQEIADREQWKVNREDEYKKRADHKGGQRYREQRSQHGVPINPGVLFCGGQ